MTTIFVLCLISIYIWFPDLIIPPSISFNSEVTRSTTSSNSGSAASVTAKLASRRSSGSSSAFSGSDVAASAGLKSFSMNDLRKATKNFGSNSYLGEGGFGCVYKGWMDEATLAPTKPGVGRMVAIKKLKKESFQGHREWLAEVTYPGELHHENLVKLVGYCSDPDSNKLLVYEYMLRGSLENHLFRRGTWCGGRGRYGARTAGENAADTTTAGTRGGGRGDGGGSTDGLDSGGFA